MISLYSLVFLSLTLIKIMLGIGLFFYAKRCISSDIDHAAEALKEASIKGRSRSNSEVVAMQQAERIKFLQDLRSINRYTVHKGKVF